ncbi:MAG: sugar transferase [bacterium]
MEFPEKEYFPWILQQEINRVERTNQPLSMLLLKISYLEELIQKNTGISPKRTTDNIFTIINDNCRKTDIKGWYDAGTLALLMPNTPKAGAFTAYTKQKDKITAYLEKIGIEAHNHFTEACSVHTFPDSILRKNDDPFPSPIPFELPKKFSLRLFIKRCMDIFGSIIGLLFFLPFMVIIGLIIKLTSPGTIFFKQIRLGYRGKPFTFYKFRSMHQHVDDASHREYVTNLIKGNHEKINQGSAQEPFLKMNNDPRITAFGKVLRKSSLDELPQLYNVLKGDMSLVGPRPPIPYEVEKYQKWHLRRILDVKPGITGLWQVRGRSSTTFDDMVRLDLHYADNWSLLMDIIILCKTITAVFSARGAC